MTRGRARLVWAATQAKNQIQTLLGARNIHPAATTLFSKAGLKWLSEFDLGPAGNVARDELLRRLEHFGRELQAMDAELQRQAGAFPEVEALTHLHGIGDYSALLIVAEIGEPDRFAKPKQVGAYAGLTARVNQSGSHCYHVDWLWPATGAPTL